MKVWGRFAVVKVNSTLTLDFDTDEHFSTLHFAFKVNDTQFDDILGRVKQEGIPFGSSPRSKTDGTFNTDYRGRGVYFKDPNDHTLEILTADYVLD